MSEWKNKILNKRLTAFFLAAALAIPTIPAFPVYASENITVVEPMEETKVLQEETVNLVVEEGLYESSDALETEIFQDAVSENALDIVLEEQATETVKEINIVEEEVIEDEEVSTMETTTSSAVYHDINGNYSLTLTVYDDSVTKYAKITGFTDKGLTGSYALTIPATVTVEGEVVPVTSIGASVFSKKTMINAVLFEEGCAITSIEKKAFSECTSICYIDEFPDTIVNIGHEAFFKCTLLNAKDKDGNINVMPELKLPVKLEKIGERAFKNCDSLQKVYVPKTLVTVVSDDLSNSGDPGAFTDCDNLTNIIIEEGTPKIADNLYFGRITSTEKNAETGEFLKPITIYIPDSVAQIGAHAFQNQTTLVDVKFGENSSLEHIYREAFAGCTALTYFSFPETVTWINHEAFKGCTKLGTKNEAGEVLEVPELVLPVKLEKIGERAFKNCDSLQKVYVPKTLVTVVSDDLSNSGDPGAFTDCDNLINIIIEEGTPKIADNLYFGRITSTEKNAETGEFLKPITIYIPDSVAQIGAHAFQNQTTLVDVKFGENSSLEHIYREAFAGCTALTYFSFPETVTWINHEAFKGCTKLGTKNETGEVLEVPELVLPVKLEKIGERAFYNCDALQKVYIPKTLVTVESDDLSNSGDPGAFGNCDNLTNIVIEEGTPKIADNLYFGRITSTVKNAETGEFEKPITFIIPDSVMVIGNNAFRNQPTLEKVCFGENSSLTTIQNGAFSQCTLLVNSELPDTVTSIGCEAFAGCVKLGTVSSNGEQLEVPELKLPADLEQIGERAFQNCDSIQKTCIPKKLTGIISDGLSNSGEPGAFLGCDNLKNITFEKGLDTIPANLFNGTIVSTEKDGVTEEYLHTISFDIPDTVTSIGKYAFRNQVNAVAITLSENSLLKTVGEGAFQNCSLLTTFDFPSQVTNIGNSAFYGCSKLEKVSLKDAVASIGEAAFSGCTSLKNMTIPVTVTSLGKNAFLNCADLEWVEFEVNNLHTDKKQSFGTGVFKNCTSLTTMKFGNKVTAIPEEMFYGCSSLEEVEFSHGITSIGKNSFYNCEALRALFIPASVTKINIQPSELAYCYEQGLKIYVEKGSSEAKTFAQNNNWETEVGIYNIQAEFPDAVLYEQMKNQRYDKNLDTYLTLRELEQIINVDLSNLGIKNMTGTQLFTSMESLTCSGNEIAVLGADTWAKLKSLNCSDNKITKLDTKGWSSLVSLDCSNNELQKLDISNSPLETLDCSNNNILVFDFSDAKTLTDVTLGQQTGTLAIEENDSYGYLVLPLPANYSEYNSKNVSEVSDEDALKPNRLGIVWEEAYDVPDKVQYQYTTTCGNNITADAIVEVTIPNAGIVITEKEYPDENLRRKINELVDTNKNGLISKVEERNCIKLDISGIEGYEITELTGLERLKNLTELVCKDNLLTALDLSKNIKLTTLDCSNNRIKEFTVSGNTALVQLNCNDNKIKELDISSNTALVNLQCERNQISKLDVAANTKLELLMCAENSLAAMEVPLEIEAEIWLGKQQITLLREKQGDVVTVNLNKYDAVFDSTKVSDITAYIGENKAESTDVELTQEGFTVKPEITVVAYKYKVPGYGKLDVTINLVDKIVEDVVIKNIGDLSIDTFIDKSYTGKETFQNIVIYDGSYLLREGVDYEVKYIDNIEVGEASVIIKGINNYCGNYTGTYKIIGEWKVSVKAIKDQTYQNKALEPKLTIKDGKKTLQQGKDYEVSYKNNINTGVASVVVSGIGDYAGSGMKEITFNITECKISKTSITIASVTYNGEAQKPVVKASYNTEELEEGKDFKVVYSKNVKAGSGAVSITGIGNYTGTVKKTFKINKLNLENLPKESIIVENAVKYNASGAKPEVSILCGEYQLVEGVDYTLSYSGNKAVGTGKVTIKGKGSCQNKILKEFSIEPQNIGDASIQIDIAIAQVNKNGKALKPKVTITQNKKKLREGENKDYVIEYNKDATTGKGAYPITIHGKNNFGESITKDFIIVEQLINKAKVKGLQNFEYDGNEQEQDKGQISLTIGKTLVPSDCYELTYDNHVEVGNAVIKITAKPQDCEYQFGGTATAKFKITAVKFKPSKTEERVVAGFQNVDYVENAKTPVVTYTGSEVLPEVIVCDEKRDVVLTEGVDYKVTYKNNVKVGKKANATIKGIKNYSGSIQLGFTIEAKDMSEYAEDFKVSVKNSAYTGKNIKPRVVVWDGDILLKENKDYVIKIEQYIETDNFKGIIKDKGKYIVTVQGKGNYSGELEEQYLSVY